MKIKKSVRFGGKKGAADCVAYLGNYTEIKKNKNIRSRNRKMNLEELQIELNSIQKDLKILNDKANLTSLAISKKMNGPNTITEASSEFIQHQKEFLKNQEVLLKRRRDIIFKIIIIKKIH